MIVVSESGQVAVVAHGQATSAIGNGRLTQRCRRGSQVLDSNLVSPAIRMGRGVVSGVMLVSRYACEVGMGYV